MVKTPVADSFWYLAKLIQFVKLKKKKKRVLFEAQTFFFKQTNKKTK